MIVLLFIFPFCASNFFYGLLVGGVDFLLVRDDGFDIDKQKAHVSLFLPNVI